MKTDVLFSSARDDWETPQEYFDKLDAEFHFNLDVCADWNNAKCKRFFNLEYDGLSQNWGGSRCWCNPPYSQIKKWAQKSAEESRKPGTLVVMLVPARTDTSWFHDFVYHRCEIRFIRGRLRFSGQNVNAPFPSMICIYRAPGLREEAAK